MCASALSIVRGLGRHDVQPRSSLAVLGPLTAWLTAGHSLAVGERRELIEVGREGAGFARDGE